MSAKSWARMVQHQENEVHLRRNVVQLGCEPLALCAGHLILRTVENKKKNVGRAN
jgi:hypothetical protein